MTLNSNVINELLASFRAEEERETTILQSLKDATYPAAKELNNQLQKSIVAVKNITKAMADYLAVTEGLKVERGNNVETLRVAILNQTGEFDIAKVRASMGNNPIANDSNFYNHYNQAIKSLGKQIKIVKRGKARRASIYQVNK